jgi:hypothetical protein
VAAVGVGHVSRVGGVPAALEAADMARDAATTAEDLDRVGAETDVAELAYQLVGDRVVMAVDLDVVVDVDLGLLQSPNP